MIKKTKIIDAFSKVKGGIDWLLEDKDVSEDKWREMRTPPEWVKDAAFEYSSGVRRSWGANHPYDKSKIFYGKTYVYKVFYKTVAQGQVRPYFYRRLKKQKEQK